MSIFDDLQIYGRKEGKLSSPIFAFPVNSEAKRRISTWLWDNCLGNKQILPFAIPTFTDYSCCLWMGIGARCHIDLYEVLTKNKIVFDNANRGDILIQRNDMVVIRTNRHTGNSHDYLDAIKNVLPERYSNISLGNYFS